MENCFACGKPIKGRPHLVTALDDQTMYVGPGCYRKVIAAGLKGYQPRARKGSGTPGPRLYQMRLKELALCVSAANASKKADNVVH